MNQLNLIALDAEDLQVLSAHLQDAVVRVGDMAYLPRERRFVGILNRFDWAAALVASHGGLARRRTALRFERVLAARLSGISLAQKDEVLSLLTIAFAPAGPDEPSGTVTLTFAGNAAVQFDVECIEAEMRDLGAVWKARGRPNHSIDEGSGASGT